MTEEQWIWKEFCQARCTDVPWHDLSHPFPDLRSEISFKAPFDSTDHQSRDWQTAERITWCLERGMNQRRIRPSQSIGHSRVASMISVALSRVSAAKLDLAT